MLPSFFNAMGIGGALQAGMATNTHQAYIPSLSPHAQSLFNQSMSWMDTFYDESAGYLYNVGGSVALRHNPRSSVWYSLGLLARNEGDDVQEAEKIITNTINGQYKVESEIWYGNYQQEPDEPYVNSSAYPAVIYKNYDPNVRGFVGTTLIMAMEEFPHLLSHDMQDLILESLHNATKGDEYRVGGVNDDNLYPAYSNPSIMRAFVAGWTGNRLRNSNMTRSGEAYAEEVIQLFNRDNTLSEFNSGTYTGVSLFGLLLWSKYLPANSTMTDNGPRMLKHTWQAIGQLWNPSMKNMAGPWDRAYGYDMNRYISLMGLWFWTLLGQEKSSIINKPHAMSHVGDYAWGPLFAILADFHQSLIPKAVLQGLEVFASSKTFTASTFYPPYDLVPRNITTWMSENLTIGAESFQENVLGGPARSQTAFNPAVVQWNTGHEISFISLYPTEMSVDVEVSPNKLVLSYPNGTASSIFSLLVGTFEKKRTVACWEDVQGLTVDITGNINETYSLSFGGAFGGADKPINDFEFWNFTYKMPSCYTGVPIIELSLRLWD